MRLFEISFGANVPFEWVKQGPEHYRADFESKDRRYFVDFYTGNWDGTPCWMFQFGIYQSDKDASTMRMTKLKNPYSVLSTVKAVFDDFMQRKHPACLAFYDGDRIPSRMRWYQQFATYVINRYGYRQDDAMMQKAMRTLSSSDTFLWILKRGRQETLGEGAKALPTWTYALEERGSSGSFKGFVVEALGEPPPMDSVKALAAWGETIGVYAEVFEDDTGISLEQIDRDEQAPKGRGAEFIRALCAYADTRGKPVYLTVTGWNDTLETYYRQFGFNLDKRKGPGLGRDEETGDVLMVRKARRRK